MTDTDALYVTEYLQQLAADANPQAHTVTRVYEIFRAAVPEAVEGRSYNMPALLYRGRGLVSVLATAQHTGIYPFSSAAIDTVRDQLHSLGISTSKGAVRLPDAIEPPSDVLTQLLRARVAEIDRRVGSD